MIAAYFFWATIAIAHFYILWILLIELISFINNVGRRL